MATWKHLSLFAIALFLSFCFAAARAENDPQAEYLSALLSDRMVSMTQGWGELGVDTAVKPIGAPAAKLRIKDKEYTHGLGHHANGEIIFDLAGQFKMFQTDFGLQWLDGHNPGSVIFRIFVDGKKVFESGVVRENDPPQSVTVSVAGAEQLRLEVNDAGDGIVSDCADWAEARLTRDPAAIDHAAPSVDVAPFGRVLSWDPKVMQGTKASRIEEMPAEDVAPYTEILPSADGSYAVPAKNGSGSVGLQWDETRRLRRVAIEFPGAADVPPIESIQLQYWTGEAQTRELQCWSGESAWQGNWQPTKAVPEKVDNCLVWRLDYREGLHGTQKVRWVFSDVKRPIALKRLSAFTRSAWKTTKVRIEAARPAAAIKADIEVYNGVLPDAPESAGHCSWNSSQPLLLKVRASVPQDYKADRTVLRFQMPGAAFGVAIEDLLANDCVYVPHANLFVTRVPSPVTPDEYLNKIAGRKTMREEVQERPDRDFSQAWAQIHSPREDGLPTLLSLACDNRKFLVEREGAVTFNDYDRADDPPGTSDGVHSWVTNVGQWRFKPSFGVGRPLSITRHLDGGWLPIPMTTVQDGNLEYRQTTYVAPASSPVAGKPAWLRERAYCALEYDVKNTGTEPSDVRLGLQLAAAKEPKRSVRWYKVAEGFVATNDNRIATINNDRVLLFIDSRGVSPLSCIQGPEGVVISGSLPAGTTARCVVYLPGWKVPPLEYASLLKDNPQASRAADYWKSLLEPALQIDVPDVLLSDIIRSSQVHCMLTARNENGGELVAPWVGSAHYGPLDSESNSIIRGMDMTGNAEFARCSIEFMLKKCNLDGYLALNYTLVGNGEILWNIGEHYQQTGDRAWMQKIAPDTVRICQWVIRQRAKTKRLDALGQKVPEYGLMPPGVSADWCRFAYRFFNDAQYYHGLEMAGTALAAIGDPAAPAILKEAGEYQQDIAQAHHIMQAKSPVVPLQNGAWVPASPALFGCYGNVENFMPAVYDVATYVYNAEVGAHHLVASGVLDPASKKADWMIDYLEDIEFLRSWRPGKIRPADAFELGGFAKAQPYYCRIAEIYAQRDEVKPFIRSYFNPIPALVAAEDLSFWESLTDGFASNGWDKTHETGWFLCQSRTMFAMERSDELWLAPFVTNHWLKDGLKISVRNAPTRFGNVNYTITSNVAKGYIEAVVQLPENCTAKKVVLRMRHPDGKPLQSVNMQGRPHKDFDPKKETVTFEPSDRIISIRAEY